MVLPNPMDQLTRTFAGAMDHGKLTSSSPVGAGVWAKWAIGALLATHLLATCQVLPPTTIIHAPLLALGDYPVHTHRAHVYRESLRQDGKPWGYDPAVCGGLVMHPVQDIGSAPYQLLAALLPRVDSSRVVAAFAWAAIVAFPLLLALTGRMLRFDGEEIAWGLLLAMAVLWFAPPHRIMVEVGMIAFLLSSYLCLFVLAAYTRFLSRPSAWGYVGATAAGSLLFFVHPFGPVAIAPALLWLVLATPQCDWKWRLAAAASPLTIAALNAVWLLPFLLGLLTPPPPWMSTLQIEHPYWTWRDWSDVLSWFGPGLIAAHAAALTASGVVLFGVLRRRSANVAAGLALTLLTALLLFLLGSFWSVTRILQPVRFATVLWTALAMLGGVAIVALRSKLRIPRWGSASALILAASAIIAVFCRFAPSLANDAGATSLLEFIDTRTAPNERLLVEAAGPSHWFVQTLPAALHRELIGSAFPDHHDPVQFLPESLFGKSAETLTPAEARRWLADFGVNWVVARSPQWQEFFSELTGRAGAAVGPYRAFSISRDPSRFLVGAGELSARVNRIELRGVRAPQGYVVIRYRFHPGWTCDPPASVEQFPTPDDSGGLLLIRNPPSKTVLRFEPLLALRRPWPETGSVGGQ